MITLSDIRDIVTIETPITEDEITSELLDRAINKSLNIINMYRPRLITGTNSYESMDEYKKLNIKFLYPVSYFKIDRVSVGLSGNTDDGKVTDLINYKIDYTFESIYEYANSNIISKFEQLVSSHCMIFAANVRRSAVMNDFPFDLLGDNFHTEATDVINSIIEDLINSQVQLLE